MISDLEHDPFDPMIDEFIDCTGKLRGFWIGSFAGGSSLEAVELIADERRGLERSYANLIKIPSFEGDPDDDALERLLEELGPVEDVRRVEKRAWWRE
ncbi:MAG: hypothetical protein R6X02_01745 [Enhygromyxa sp.]